MITTLISNCILNDERSKTKLFEFQYNLVRRVVSKYFFDTDTINELVQLSFIDIFKNLDKSTLNFNGWCYTIATNKCLTFKRSLKIKKNSLLSYRESYFDQDLLNVAEIVDEDIINKEKLHSEILKHIDSLTPIYKKTFEMHYLENKTYKEISEILGNSESSCKTNCMKARNKIKNKIKKEN